MVALVDQQHKLNGMVKHLHYHRQNQQEQIILLKVGQQVVLQLPQLINLVLVIQVIVL
jgi:hypothetical protein